ncbi:MAG TPA: hypothetical protein VE824_05420 [Gaiellales bacterium]|nr:hypothetical protein [Gaiellales bacterium]
MPLDVPPVAPAPSPAPPLLEPAAPEAGTLTVTVTTFGGAAGWTAGRAFGTAGAFQEARCGGWELASARAAALVTPAGFSAGTAA